MPKTRDEGIILKPTKLYFEKRAVLNPSCIVKDGVIHMYYRAVDPEGKSTIGYCTLSNHTNVVERWDKPILEREYEYERSGIEDPRIVELESKFYLFYTAYDGTSARIAYAVGDDLHHFKKGGLLSPNITYEQADEMLQKSKSPEEYSFFKTFFKKTRGANVLLWEKDGFIFPKRIGGKIAFVHRVPPNIEVAFINDLSELNDMFWLDYLRRINEYIILSPKYKHENWYIGGGAVPLETEEGWLLIYHGVELNDSMKKVYHGGAALLDKKDPRKVIGRLKQPLFSPDDEWELAGDVDNVVFPSGVVDDGGRLYIYYGAADSLIAAISVDKLELLEELKQSGKE